MRAFLTSLTMSSLVALGLAGAPSAGAAETPSCPRQAGELVRAFRGAVWVRDGALHGCTAFYADEPVTRRLGAWERGAEVVYDGRYATWVTHGGGRDRVTSVDVGSGAFRFRDAMPVAGVPGDKRVAALKAYSYGVAWVTGRGTLVLSVPASRRAPSAVGATSAGADGLELPLRPAGTRVVVGRWPGAADAVARSLTIDSAGGAGDECGGISSPVATVKPTAAGARVGARWDLTFRTARSGC